MRLLRNISSIILNKYLLTLTVFVAWLLFFDRNDLFTQLEWRKELRELQKSKAYLEHEIAENRRFSNELKNNPAAIEKLVREKYLMKRDNEDLFLVLEAGKN
ncbi:MAG TPA: septum formation initiator family protein [Flavisolibacter sp.]